MAFLSRTVIESMGFAAVGDNVFLSDKASFYNCGNISLGSNVRIDDFCVLSAGQGGIVVGSYVHIAVYSSMIGNGKIHLGNFCNISSRVSIYSSSDDFSGEWMTNPTVPQNLTGVQHAGVLIGHHVVVGSGSVVLPGVTVKDGVAVGALSLVKKRCEAFGIYAGVPVRRIGERQRRFLQLEKQLDEGNLSADKKRGGR